MENNIIALIKNIIKENINNSTQETLNIDNVTFYKDTNALMIASYFGIEDIVKELGLS